MNNLVTHFLYLLMFYGGSGGGGGGVCTRMCVCVCVGGAATITGGSTSNFHSKNITTNERRSQGKAGVWD